MQSKENYNNSRPFNLHRTSSYVEVERAIAALLSQLYKKPRKDAGQHLKTLVMDLYAVHNIDPKRWLGHARSAKWYRKRPKRYNGLKLTGDRIGCLIDRLREHELIHFQPGFPAAHKKDEQGQRTEEKYEKGRWSRMRATPKLIERLQKCGVQPHMAELCDCEEVIVLRGPKKTWKVMVKRRRRQKDGSYKYIDVCEKREKRGDDIDYSDTVETRRMRKSLKLINERLSQHWIDLHIPDSDIPRLNKALRRKEDAMPFEPSRVRLHRIFSNRSFKQGGRFYGAWWQEIPSDCRKHIRIDGQPTREIDFSGMHIRMLYAQVGKSMPEGVDPYELEGYSPKDREFLKTSFQKLINAGSEDAAIGAMMKEAGIKDPDTGRRKWEGIPHREKYMRQLLADFKEKHCTIAQYFYDGTGIKLQYTDSQIAEDVMLVLGDEGIPVLPIHDSFLVPSTHHERLKAVMLAAWERHLPGCTAGWKLICSADDDRIAEFRRQFATEQSRQFFAEEAAEFHDVDHNGYCSRGNQWRETERIRKPSKHRSSGRLAAYMAAATGAADATKPKPSTMAEPTSQDDDHPYPGTRRETVEQ